MNNSNGERAKIIAFANQKGGVSKTTSCLTIGQGLADRGYKVLLIDMDAQCNLTYSLPIPDYIPNGSEKNNIFSALKGSDPVEDCVFSAYGNDEMPNLFIIPGSPLLTTGDGYEDEDDENVGLKFAGNNARYLLSEAINDNISEYFDYLLIDTNPTINVYMTNSFIVSDYIIVTFQLALYSAIGLRDLSAMINKVRSIDNPDLKILGIALTMVSRNNISKKIRSDLKETLGENINIFKTGIRTCCKMQEVLYKRGSIFKYSPKSNLAIDYNKLIDEILEALGEPLGGENIE